MQPQAPALFGLLMSLSKPFAGFVSGVEFTSTVAGIALKRRTMLCLRRTGNLILVSLILRH